MKKRGSGVLFHLTSLPSNFGIGDMGPWSYKFADFLSESEQSYWQILPLNPTEVFHGNSPYHSASAFALNPLLISPEILIQDGYLMEEELAPLQEFPSRKTDYRLVTAYKDRLFERAFEHFKTKGTVDEYKQFCSENAYWLDDYEEFVAEYPVGMPYRSYGPQ